MNEKMQVDPKSFIEGKKQVLFNSLVDESMQSENVLDDETLLIDQKH